MPEYCIIDGNHHIQTAWWLFPGNGVVTLSITRSQKMTFTSLCEAGTTCTMRLQFTRMSGRTSSSTMTPYTPTSSGPLLKASKPSTGKSSSATRTSSISSCHCPVTKHGGHRTSHLLGL
ncbi:uncharacterized protein ACA1_271360 [Acanthamoeba castellanii str. Neff]|uniref:Uncharacterized protein n=1 Tax=Acanthamoeba castellanii (strain ATCC 30010 / Neff) TaxID=1257118 RepID=L8GR61_ACACF|nr:uncharacterized protein ACA1_271360 [Acanthamoeba castellanii str. Neff]ELR14601.1 hypothetical protein ACA1_271360 [Acanthamoeba castellanii str. Neff]